MQEGDGSPVSFLFVTGPTMFDLTIATERLILRPFRLADAPRVRELAGAWEIASMVGSIPHPYPDGLAASWIAMHDERRATGKGYPFAVTWDGDVIGSLGIEQEGDKSLELGYWFGVPYWGQGFATEAASALLRFAFGWLAQCEIVAGYIVDNTASARVLGKLGFVRTGQRKRTSRARGEVNCIDVSLTRDEWAAKQV
jgi:ribosomal-protein-alanine N-acetyltransferase